MMKPEEMKLWLPNQLARRDRIWTQRQELAKIVFGEARAKEIEIASAHLVEMAKLPKLNAFEVAMQLETEWPGHLEDIFLRADTRWAQAEGKVEYLAAVMDVVKWIRAREPGVN